MNNLYEYGDLCNVVIRCNFDCTIGGKQYRAGEPYTILENVIVSLSYRTTNSDVAAQSQVIATRNGLPDYISISNIALNDKVMMLVADKQEQKLISNFCYCEAWSGEIYLPCSQKVSNVWVYDTHNNLITDFIIDNDKIIGDFIDGQNYLIFYDFMSINKCFAFDTPHYGYFTLEVFAKGNTDKVTDPLYIKFPAASLMSIPVFDFVSGSILHTPLQWQIIHRGQEQSYFHIGE